MSVVDSVRLPVICRSSQPSVWHYCF